jgi:hypothetical protein
VVDYNDDEELEDDEDELDPSKRQPLPKPVGVTSGDGIPIGAPIRPTNPAPVPGVTPPTTASIGAPIAPPSTGPAPDVPQGSPPAMPTSIGSPINVPAPRPAGQHLEELASHPFEEHGWKRALDTIVGSTKLGQAAEVAGGWGNIGHQAKLNRAEQAAEAENSQINQGELERKANIGMEDTAAQIEQRKGLAQKDIADAAAKTAGASNVMITVPASGGMPEHTISVPAAQAGAVYRQLIGNQGKMDVVGAQDTSKENIANSNNTSKEKINEATNTSKEKIATWKNQTAEEIAKHRQELGTGTLVWGTFNGEPVLYNNKTGVPIHMAEGLGPKQTAQTQAMGEQGAAIHAMVPALLDQIDAISPQLGPFSGRFNQAYVNRLGADDPAFASLDQGLGLFASGVAKAHFGARGAAGAALEFKKHLTEAQTVDDLKARINESDAWMLNYAKHSGQHTGPAGNTLPGPPHPPGAGMKWQTDGQGHYRETPIHTPGAPQ